MTNEPSDGRAASLSGRSPICARVRRPENASSSAPPLRSSTKSARELMRGTLAEGATSGKGRIYRFQSLRSEEHTSELQSLMRISYAVFCLKKKNNKNRNKK